MSVHPSTLKPRPSCGPRIGSFRRCPLPDAALTKHEIASYANKRELMTAETPGKQDAGGSLSVLDIERRSHELLVQSFHLFDENQMVIKTQAIIEVVKSA